MKNDLKYYLGVRIKRLLAKERITKDETNMLDFFIDCYFILSEQ